MNHNQQSEAARLADHAQMAREVEGRNLTAAERWAILAADAEETTRQKQRRALREIEAVRQQAATAPAHGGMRDEELRRLATRRAERMGEHIDGIAGQMTAAALLAWLNGHTVPMQGRPFAFEGDSPEGEQLRGFMARARCALWWRRQLRRAAVREREGRANRLGEVNATARQPYVTHDTAHRHRLRAQANAAMMAATELENEAGQVMTLADLAATTTSSKAIRRGELMTRITGCERLAEHHGQRGVFLTLTAPSRFHRVHRHGGLNARSDGSTPRQAQAWLCERWAQARAALQRAKVAVFGFRVAEPHHDGCPHWHALLWAHPGQLDAAVEIIRAAWLKLRTRGWRVLHAKGCTLENDVDARAMFDAEPGAEKHRCQAKEMRAGGAAGYVAKYIAKNIDDAGAVGAEGHTDDGGEALPEVAQQDLFGGTAARVEAWASAHGIRQFQAIGQPPVTVWRELRRIKPEAQAGATPRLRVAFEACNRDGLRRADWAAYVLAQGGLWTGRKYLLRVAAVVEERTGRYETTDEARPVGVTDTTGPGDWHLSNRRQWKPRGTWCENDRAPVRGPFAAAKPAQPWTRVNNCTDRNRAADLMNAGIVGVHREIQLFRTGGGPLKAHHDPARDRSPRH